MSLYLLFSKGGWLMWPVLACSVIGLAVFMERLLYFWRIGRRGALLPHGDEADGRDGMERLFMDVAGGSRYPILVADMVAEVWQVREGGYGAVTERLEMVLDEAVARASSGLGLLSTLISLSPLLGLLGTVMGLIRAFMVIERAGGRVNACALAGGIWEAMLTTAAGLAVAIILTVLHKFLAYRVDRLEETLLRTARLLITSLQEGKEDQDSRNPVMRR